ncbi:MAG: AAA family ATPase, partial [Caldilineaceae bacterium]|nr:AAA family ATPase [Caldilineaceae bacterium]
MNSYPMRFFGPGLLFDPQGQAVAMRSRKQLALLVYLASEHQTAHSRDTLLSLLWPDEARANAQNNLRFTLSNLRTLTQKMVGDDGKQSPLVVANRHTVQLHPDWVINTDVNHFQQLLAETRKHGHSGRSHCATCQPTLAQAVALYEQEFMAGFGLDDCAAFEEWLFWQREQLHLLAHEAYRDLATYAESNGDYPLAKRYAQHLIELDPLSEIAYRQQMRILAQLGERSAALTLFERCRTLLAEELGLDPEAETLALHMQLLNADGPATIEEVPQPVPADAPTDAPVAAPADVDAAVGSPISSNLPQLLTPFIGREEELEQLQTRLSSPRYRLISIVGPGGIGKTRLAIEAAHANQDHFAQGVCFVSLAGVHSA